MASRAPLAGALARGVAEGEQGGGGAGHLEVGGGGVDDRPLDDVVRHQRQEGSADRRAHALDGAPRRRLDRPLGERVRQLDPREAAPREAESQRAEGGDRRLLRCLVCRTAGAREDGVGNRPRIAKGGDAAHRRPAASAVLQQLRREQPREAAADREEALVNEVIDSKELRVSRPSGSPQQPHRLCQPEQARDRLCVANVCLGGADGGSAAGAVAVAENRREGARLGRVAERGARAMRLDAVYRRPRRRCKCAGEQAALGESVWRRQARAAPVLPHGRALKEEGPSGRNPRGQHNRGGGLAPRVAVGPPVEGLAAAVCGEHARRRDREHRVRHELQGDRADERRGALPRPQGGRSVVQDDVA
jgi:hypothetical protein